MDGNESRNLRENLEGTAVSLPADPLREFFGEPIHTYTRAQALEDGVLVDVTETAREAGIKYPVALTAEVFAKYVKVPEGVTCQDVRGRLWDILWMFRCHANGVLRPVAHYREGLASVMHFKFYVQNDARLTKPKLATLKAHCGPGDQVEPVITIMLPDQD
jgi:hypothetical protein